MSELVDLAETTVVKAGNAFCVALRDGRLPLAGDHTLGLYEDDCRHLRGCELRLGGAAPRLLSSSDAPGTAAVFELTNPHLPLEDGRTLSPQSLRVRVERRVAPATMVDRISVRSYAPEPVALDLELLLDADFRPLLEVRGVVAPAVREVRRRAESDTLSFAATGLDGHERTTTVRCVGGVAERDRLRIPMTLGPGEAWECEVRATLGGDPGNGGDHARTAPRGDAGHGGGGAHPARSGDGDGAPSGGGDPRTPIPEHVAAAPAADAWLAERPAIDAGDGLVDRVLRRSLLDLRMLVSDLDGQRYYAAGLPWYATLFGRDSIVAALEALPLDHTIAGETLRLLADRLGERDDPERDEEPGKVVHELRRGEIALSDATPLARYYGTVDATPLFLCLLCDHADWCGSLQLFRELRPQVELALRWIDTLGDLDGDGLLEYRSRSSAGLVNQGWKDSRDAIVDERGATLDAPIAVVEAQGYALRAKRRLAALLELDGEPERAAQLRDDALALARGIERFWLPEQGFYAMALDAGKRASRALASNQGHLLWARAVPAERAAAIRAVLTSDDAYSGWGVRTLAEGEPAFDPLGYHTGSVWPHDNALVAIGLREYGFDDAFLRVFEGMLDAAAGFRAFRLPELFAGYSRGGCEPPVPCPGACSPQAWAAGALSAMLTAGLGLVPDGLRRKLRIRRPCLPRQIDRLRIQGLRVADARVDLTFERAAERPDRVALVDARADGDLEVIEIAPDWSP